MTCFVDDYELKFSFLPATKGKGRQQSHPNLFTNIGKLYLENEMHYFDCGEVCDVRGDIREFKFHLNTLILCGKPGKFILKIRIIHRARQKPELCRTMNIVIRPIETDCRYIVNFPDTVFEGDLSEEPLRFTSAWEPKLFERAPWTWSEQQNGNFDHFFVNNYASGQITLHLNNVSISMNQRSYEGQLVFTMALGQTLLPDTHEPTSSFAIERIQKHRPSNYNISFRPSSSNSRNTIRGKLNEMFFVSPPKASHGILLHWKTTTDQWDAPTANSLVEQINLRYQVIKDVRLQPQAEILCHAGEQTELLIAVVSDAEDDNQVLLSKPDDYNINLTVQKGRGAAISHDVEIVSAGTGKLVLVKFLAPQSAAGPEYNCTLAVSSKRARSSDQSITVMLCKIVIVPQSGYLRFESGESPMHLVPTSKPSFYELKNMKLRLKTHSSVHNSPYANSLLKLQAHNTATMKEATVEKNGPAAFKLRNSVCDAEFLKFSIGPLLPNTKVKIQVFVQDVDQVTVVRKCYIDLLVPSDIPGQASSASSAQHASSFADDAKRLDKSCRDLDLTLKEQEAKKQRYEELKRLEGSIKTVDFGSEDDALTLRQKILNIPGCYIAGDTAKVLLPVFYLHHTIACSIEQLPESSKHLLELPTNTELKTAGAILAWKLSELLQQDTFATVIIDAKHANRNMSSLQIHQAEEKAIREVASQFGQMKFRFLRVCSMERFDENRRNLFERFPLIAADEHFITDPATPKLFDRCEMKPPQCESVLDRPIGFLDWAVNLLHFDPKIAALQFRLKFWLPLLQNVAVFDRSQHAEEYKKYRENPDIGLPPITIITVFDDYFFHHDSASGISSYRSAPKPDDVTELYKREWGMRVAPAIDRLSSIKREIETMDVTLDSFRTRLRESQQQLLRLDPSAAANWAVEVVPGQRDGRGGRAARREEGGAQPSKRTKFGESPGNLE